MTPAVSVALLAALAVVAPPASGPRIVFQKTLPGEPGRADVAAHVLPVKDGAIVTGWTTLGDAPADAFVLRVDRDGNQVWRRNVGGAGLDILFALAADPAGGSVAAGMSDAGDGKGADGWVVSLDDTGGVRWQVRHGGEGADRFTSIARALGGGAWIVAGQKAGAGGTDAWVVRLDAYGKPGGEWSSRDPRLDGALAAEATRDGGAVVVGVAGPSREEGDGFVTRLDPGNRSTWTHRFGGPGRQLAYHLAPARRDTFLVTGYGDAGPEQGTDGLAFLITPKGEVAVTWSLGDTANDRAVHGIPFTGSTGSTGAVVGYSKPRSAPDEGAVWTTIVYGLAPDGSVAWRRSLDGLGRESGRWIAGTRDDLWVVTQTAGESGESRVVVARLSGAP